MSSAGETSARRRVAFVIDDGPVEAQTAKFLELFAREHVRVSFSYVGKNVVALPSLAKAAADAGHEINNHSFTHPHLKTLDDAALAHELGDASAAIEKATGRKARWFWAPFLELDGRVAHAALAAGQTPFPFTKYTFLSTDDWNTSTPAATIRQKATTGLGENTVILCHEWRPETLAEMPAIIAELKRQGCEFVTFSELAAAAP